ncbi:MAG TPA: hypothetical protein PK614_00615 [Nitrospira sp.]|nr:hypothetical protein [Nitrospira sp.]
MYRTTGGITPQIVFAIAIKITAAGGNSVAAPTAPPDAAIDKGIRAVGQSNRCIASTMAPNVGEPIAIKICEPEGQTIPTPITQPHIAASERIGSIRKSDRGIAPAMAPHVRFAVAIDISNPKGRAADTPIRYPITRCLECCACRKSYHYLRKGPTSNLTPEVLLAIAIKISYTQCRSI